MEYTNTIRFLLTPVLVLSLSACSWLGIGGEDGWLRDRQGEYLRATVSPRMDIPPELDTFTIDELYPIPEEPPGPAEYFVVPPPPKPMDSRVREGVTLQRFGDRAWIVVGASPSQVWPMLLEFWPTSGMEMGRADVEAGIMESVWLEEQEGDQRHKYRLLVEPGLHAGNSEIHVTEVTGNSENSPDEPREWPEESDSQEYRNFMLNEVSVYLAERSDLYQTSSVSLLAGSIEEEGKARLLTGRGTTPTRLELRLDFSRAWSQVSQALDGASIEVTAADRENRRFTVAFSGEESEDGPGFFSRLFRREQNDTESVPFHVDLQEQGDAIMVEATPVSGEEALRLQDLLVRTINDNLI